MSNTSLVITLKSPYPVATMAQFLKASSNPRTEAVALSGLFESLASGALIGSFDVQTSASAPVRASGTFTLTYASITDQDTCVIAGVTLTCVTGTPSGDQQFKKQTNATVTATNLVACVNAQATLKLLVVASSAAGVVTISSLMPGAVGNFMGLTGSTGIVRSASTLASGAGGAETVAVNYSRGI